MRDEVLEMLCDLNDSIATYEGENLIEDGMLDSIQIIELVNMIEEQYEIELNPEDVITDNFKSIDNIISLIDKMMSNTNS